MVTDEQLKRYADVICAWQVGNDSSEISTALSLPEPLVHAWLVNFLEMDRGTA